MAPGRFRSLFRLSTEMLNGIDLVANDLDMNRGTTAPTFRIRELQIGGE
jgi:hypothetical protein